MSEFRIARVDCWWATTEVYPSLESAESFLRTNWSRDPSTIGARWEHLQHLYAIVQWDEGEELPTRAWRLEYPSEDLVEIDVSEVYVEPAGS